MKFYFFRIELTKFLEFDNLKLKDRLVDWESFRFE